MNSLRQITLYNIERKRRFQFQSVFQKQQIKDQLGTLLQQMQLFFIGGLTPKQIMKIINGVNDEMLTGVCDMHNVDFKKIKNKIKNYDVINTDSNSLDFARQIVNNILNQENV